MELLAKSVDAAGIPRHSNLDDAKDAGSAKLDDDDDRQKPGLKAKRSMMLLQAVAGTIHPEEMLLCVPHPQPPPAAARCAPHALLAACVAQSRHRRSLGEEDG